MIRRLHTDTNGWVINGTTYDGPAPDDLGGHEASGEDMATHALARGLAWRGGDGVLRFPQDDRDLWKHLRARGLDGSEASERLLELRDVRRICRGEVPLAPGVARAIPGPYQLPGLPYSFPEVPGLVLRPALTEDLDKVAQATVELGDQPVSCPPDSPCRCTPPEAHAFLALAQEWDKPSHTQLVLEWNQNPLQWELMFHDQDEDMPVSSRTYHLTRERPHWFWREAWKPVADGLVALGFPTMSAIVRGDLDYYTQSLKYHYKATVRRRSRQKTTLDYDLATIPFAGWPARRALQGDVGVRGVTIQEATEAELPDVIGWLQANRHSRTDISVKMLREWFFLDRSAVLVARVNDVIQSVRTVRERRPTVSSIAQLSTLKDDPDAALTSEAVRRWQVGCGYTKATRFTPEAIYDNPLMQATLAREGFRPLGRRNNGGGGITTIESEADL